MENYLIEKFDIEKEKIWDDFVINNSINGTFLQTRRFINYHPKDRFIDCSLMFYNKSNKLVAVCPACEVYEDDKKCFWSHKGTTYGGIIIAKKFYKAKYVLPLVLELEKYLKNEEFNKVYLKITPDIFSIKNPDLLEYAFYYQGYEEYKELNTYIDFNKYLDEIESNFSQGKRTHVHKSQRLGMEMRSINSNVEIEEYYEILCENLSKYNLSPVHTCDELKRFNNEILKNECEFFGVFLNEEMIAGGMLFYFNKTKTAHTQYLSSKNEYLKISPVSFLYYSIIDEMKNRGFNYLSWGICTEDFGRYINRGLVSSKEDYGSTYSNNLTYYKQL